MQKRIEELIRKTLPDQGEHIWGFADLSGLLHDRFKGYGWGIVIGRRLDDATMDSVKTGPNPEYLKLYKDTNTYLSDLVTDLAGEIKALGIGSLAILANSSQVDRSPDYALTLRHHFSHKMVGTRAGLGWIGKSDLFISKIFGPRLRMASILVDYPLKPLYAPIDKSRCGKCNVCVEACPAEALNGKLWNIKVDRDEYLDTFKCRNKIMELALAGTGQNEPEICGICISVCPASRSQTR